MTAPNKYQLTLEDAESGMTLAHKKPGFIEVGLSSEGVEFSLPLHFLELFVKSIGGQIALPDTLHNSTSAIRGKVILTPQTTDRKINFIKAVRQVCITTGSSIGLKDAKELVEKVMGGSEYELYEGPIDKARAMTTTLKNEGWACRMEAVV
jgi:ribosomal protein L7/L12